jgi:acyl carrier protein
MHGAIVTQTEIEAVVLGAIRNLNLARRPEMHVEAAPDAPLFGAGSPLDSLGLVTLIIDVEEALRDSGHDITLSDEQAMSRSHSPFRSVPALVAYIEQRLNRTS